MIVSITTAPNSMRIAVIYRPPASSCSKLIEEVNSFLEDTALGGDSLVIVGDFNIHMDTPSQTYSRKLLELCTAFDLIQHVTLPTHIKGHTVDLVFSRSTDRIQPTHPRQAEMISDHYTVFCDLTISNPKPVKREITYRNLKSIDMEQFRNDIIHLPIYTSSEGMS